MSPQAFIKEVKEHNTRYVIIVSETRGNVLREWLRKHKNIKETELERGFVYLEMPFNKDFNRHDILANVTSPTKVSIFELLPGFVDEKVPEEYMITQETIDYMNYNKEHEPKLFNWYKDHVFLEKLKMTEGEFFAILNRSKE